MHRAHKRDSGRNGIAILVLLWLIVLTGCQAPAFDYEIHKPPRVSVIHKPLHPRPGQTIQFIAQAEPGPGATVAKIQIVALLPGAGLARANCPPWDGERVCVLDVASGSDMGLALYSAFTVDSRGRRAAAPSAYTFQIGDPPGKAIYPLRKPFDLYRGEQAFQIMIVCDKESYGSDRDSTCGTLVQEDAEKLIYDGLLSDPAYLWRDDQLAFAYITVPGVTRGYHSGVQSRCGQDTWLGRPYLPREIREGADDADVIAVVHRKDGYRDCAGLGGAGYGEDTQGTLSADGRRPEVLHHELGHALAGLSDEYLESTESRTTRADDLIGFDRAACSCCDGLVACLPGQPRCADITLPPECFPAPQICPPLESSCPHPNVFASQEKCEAAAREIMSHPGVELPTNPSDCRQLCPDRDRGLPCPCLSDGDNSEVWILDRRSPPPVPDATPDDDVMGYMEPPGAGEWVGPACERCIETIFCLRWEHARGRTQAQAQEHCGAP